MSDNSRSSEGAAVVTATTSPVTTPVVNKNFITRRRRMEIGMDIFSAMAASSFSTVIWVKALGGPRTLLCVNHMLASTMFCLAANERSIKQQSTHLVSPAVGGTEFAASIIWLGSAIRLLRHNNFNVWFTGHNATMATFISLYYGGRWAYAYWYGRYDVAPGQAQLKSKK